MKINDKTLIIPENNNFEIVSFDYDEYEKHGRKRWFYNHFIKSSTTISKESTSQANGDGNGDHLLNTDEDIV